jgi:cytochrome c-type biogenesis protein CcmE
MSKSTKILIGIVVISLVCTTAIFVASGVLLVNSASSSSTQYFLTVDELVTRKDRLVERNIRLSGAVIGESITFEESSSTLSFQIANVPADYAEVEQQGGLAMVLQSAVNDPNRQRIQIIYVGEKPELLRDMAQAIVTGQLHSDGIFYAEELLLKCPSRYEEAVPEQAIN